MTDRNRTDEIAALEQVRDRLEARLQTIRGSAGGESLPEFGNPAVYKSWRLVSEAIDSLRTADVQTGRKDAGEPLQRGGNDTPDDLTSIRGIDTALSGRLAALGVTRFAEIAAWRAEDVRSVSQALGLTREISRQNWIEQAALLARRKQNAEAEPAGLDFAAPSPTSPMAPSAASHVAQSSLDRLDLTEIVQAIRNQAPKKNDVPTPGAPETAPQTPRELPGATPELSTSTAGNRVAWPLDQPVAGVEREHVSLAEQPPPTSIFPNLQGSRIPTVTASARIRMDAVEWPRRLDDARQRLARSELADDTRPPDVEEAEVVIRETSLQAPTSETWTPRPRNDPLDRFRAQQEPTAARYVASKETAAEAEVVVVRPSSQTPAGPARRSDGSLRRLLKALKGD